jgi:two-component system, NarL family, nitrate/nitrite response regulator NarL
MSDLLRVLIADDHPLFRQGVVHALGWERDIVVVGEASSGEEALRLAQELLPHVLLLDVSMPGCGGLVSVANISAACPATAIVMLTVSEDKDKLLAAFKAGARGYVLKGISGSDLAAVIRSTTEGEVYVSPALAAEMLVSLTQGKAPDPLQELTPREHEILAFIGSGLTNREIGERLSIAEKTVKHYVTNILQKLQVRSRVEAALLVAHREHTRH